MSEKIKFSSEQKLSFSLYLGASFSFLVWQLPADAIRCEKIHSLPCQRCRVLQTVGYIQAALQQEFGSPLVLSEGMVTMFVGKPSHLHAFVGAIEGQYVMYYFYYCFKMGRVD